MPDLSDDISAAVDSAVSGSPGSSPTAPDAAASPSAPVVASSTTAPAAASGLDAQSPAPRSPDAPTIPASDPKTASDNVPSGNGEPPKEKWPTILENARKDREIEVLQRYGIPPQADAVTLRTHVSALIADPVKYHRELGESLTRVGLLRPESAPVAPAPMQAPVNIEPDYVTPDGAPVYSATTLGKLLEQRENALRQEFSKLVNPLQEAHRQAEIESIQAQSFQSAKEQIDEAMTWDGFAELRDGIKDLMSRDGRVTMESAYARLHKDWRKGQDSKLKAETRQAVLAEINKAPIVNTAMPGAATPTARPKRGATSLDQRFDDAIATALNASAVS